METIVTDYGYIYGNIKRVIYSINKQMCLYMIILLQIYHNHVIYQSQLLFVCGSTIQKKKKKNFFVWIIWD